VWQDSVLNMAEAESRSGWGGRRSGAGRPSRPGSRRIRRKHKPANLACDEQFMQRLTFIRDTAGDASRDSIKNWRGWQHSSELHCHALQDDLDRVVEMLGALLSGDSRPFQGPEFADWKQKRDARRKIN